MKKIFKFLAAILFAILLALLLVPFVFKDELMQELKNMINESVNAKVDFEDLDISLIRSFPDIKVNLLALDVEGVDEFEGQKLLETRKLGFKTNFKSIFKPGEGLLVKSLDVDGMKLNLLVNEAGLSNYLIMKESKQEGNQAEYRGEIESYSLTNSTINYTDRQSNMSFKMDSINHSGKGDFKSGVFDLITETTVQDIDLSYQGIPYVRDMTADVDLNLNIDLNKQEYIIGDNSWLLNSLPLSLEGRFKLLESSYEMNIQSKSSNKSTAEIFSILPGIYKEKLNEFETEGAGSFKLLADGKYEASTNTYPAILVDLAVISTRINNKKTNIPIEDINGKIKIAAQQGNWNDMSVNIDNLQFQLEESQFSTRLNVNNLLGNTRYDGQMLGKINLASLAKALNLQDMKINDGLIDTDMSLKTQMSDVLSKNYNAITFNGKLDLSNFSGIYNSRKITVASLNSQLSPKELSFEIKDLYLDDSDLSMTGKLDNPLMLLENKDGAQLTIEGRSQFINADDLMNMANSQTTTQVDTSASMLTAKSQSVLPDLNVSYTVNELKYSDYKLTDANLNAAYANDKLNVKNVKAKVNDQAFNGYGELENLQNYMFENDTVKGKLYLSSQNFNFNQINTSPQTSTTPQEQILVPDRIDVALITELDRLIYNKLNIENFTGQLVIKDKILSLVNTSAKLLGGRIALEGNYDCHDEDAPIFNFKYDLSQLPFNSLFEVSPLFQKLAPLAEYIEGGFNSTLVMSGPIGKDMMPVFHKITASGFLETLKTSINGLPVFKKAAEKLGINSIKNWYIRDSRNWFDIKDGFVDIKPYSFILEDINCELSGAIGIDRTLDLKLQTVIPREILDSGKATGEISKQLAQLSAEAKKIGVDLGLGSDLILKFDFGGKVDDPTIKLTPVGTTGTEVKDAVKDKLVEERDKLIDTINTRVQEEKDKLQDKANEKINQQKDTLIKKTEKEIDKIKEEAQKKIEEQLDSTLIKVVKDSTIKEKVTDILKGTGNTSDIDSIKQKITEWNPFKKKKD